ncbi:hypothetical protein MC7420_8329 [Coleofasciculus chthonoplastes PCC 7420]|uniref:Uncharacterized protein n=1 Tax=Coleofasciculus chthonoplastes PCC 7420 TaxID=118168 RepID=B4W0V6_9CYAN|nr:hypothetical protein [Coleofasciculus chthonoplastes]EDX72237.1 hypothetical protein MC7420_8329 [Coleofasciculus chthonoplastes PCC 7420]
MLVDWVDAPKPNILYGDNLQYTEGIAIPSCLCDRAQPDPN